MASPPKFTANAAAPLSAEELEGDRAASPQTTDPMDKPDTADTSRPASEGHLADDPDDKPAGGGEEMLTRLPPG